LLQCTYDLPIPLAHTTINSISVLVIIRVLPPSYGIEMMQRAISGTY